MCSFIYVLLGNLTTFTLQKEFYITFQFNSSAFQTRHFLFCILKVKL